MENEVVENKNRKGFIRSWLEILIVSLRLGLTSFGGPIAHLGYFHEEYVRRRKWLDERSYADLVALCQFLPGPASSQVGIGIGIMRAGVLGGVVSFIGFTLPSIIALVIFALALQSFDIANAGWINGLKIVAVAVVAHAILGMGKALIPDRNRATIALLTIVGILVYPTAFIQVLFILLAGLAGLWLYRDTEIKDVPSINVPISHRLGTICLSIFFGLLILLPILRGIFSFHWLAVFDSFYRAGSLVFGGGHVVLPLLEREVVPVGWVSAETFIAGYGAVQAVPGPLFTFASYLGAIMDGWVGALVATIAIFLPAFLLIIGALPFWNTLRQYKKVQGALFGVNAAVVGILVAALYNPIFTSSIFTPNDFALAIILFGMLTYWKLPPWMVVITGIVGGTLIQYL